MASGPAMDQMPYLYDHILIGLANKMRFQGTTQGTMIRFERNTDVNLYRNERARLLVQSPVRLFMIIGVAHFGLILISTPDPISTLQNSPIRGSRQRLHQKSIKIKKAFSVFRQSQCVRRLSSCRLIRIGIQFENMCC